MPRRDAEAAALSCDTKAGQPDATSAKRGLVSLSTNAYPDSYSGSTWISTRTKELITHDMSAILTAMSVSTRRFLREFPAFRERAEQGETVVIESRKGMKFGFHRIGEAPRPRRVEQPLPRKTTDNWNVDSPATNVNDWEMNL